MKQIVSNCSYSPATNVVTLTGVNIDADQLLLIVAPQVGRTLYNFASVTGTVSAGADTRVSLNASTAGLTTTSPLVIFYDDQASAQTVTGTVALDPASLVALENVTVTIGSSVTIAGTVTANLSDQLYDSGTPVFVAAYLNSPGGTAIPVSQDANAGMPISGTVTVGASSVTFNSNVAKRSDGSWQPLSVESGSNYVNANVQNSITIGSLPAISGTVTVSNATTTSAVFVKICGELDGAGTNEAREILTDNTGMLYVRLAPNNARTADPVIYDPVSGTAYINVRQQSGTSITVGNSVTIGSLPAISGTVTANNEHLSSNQDGGGFPVLRSGVYAYDYENDIQVGVAVLNPETSFPALNIGGTVTVGNSVTIGSLPAISGTVTANNPSGALTTRFGSVVTANLAFITSAVTNTSRKYLLAQNISAGTVTIGIGFSPTTTQGIQLTAGGGLTFDSFCPTGAVYWLGAVTGAAFTILEG